MPYRVMDERGREVAYCRDLQTAELLSIALTNANECTYPIQTLDERGWAYVTYDEGSAK